MCNGIIRVSCSKEKEILNELCFGKLEVTRCLRHLDIWGQGQQTIFRLFATKSGWDNQ